MLFLKAYVGAVVAFLLVDGLWIFGVAQKVYERDLGDWLQSPPRMPPVALFYLAYVAGLVYLAVLPALAAGSWQSAALTGAIIGALAFGTFAVSNRALLQRWTFVLMVTDLLWGMFLSSLAATCGYLTASLLG